MVTEIFYRNNGFHFLQKEKPNPAIAKCLQLFPIQPPRGNSPLMSLTSTSNSTISNQGFPCGSEGKESACNAGDLSWIPGLDRSPGKENGNPLQYSCLENPMDRGAWRATVHRVAKSGHY